MDLLFALLDRLRAASGLLTLFLAYWLTLRAAERRASSVGLTPAEAASVEMWLGVGALVGARLAAVLPDWPRYMRYPFDLIYIQGGLSFHGGLMGALLALAALAWRGRLPFGAALDLFGPATAWGIGLYRFACAFREDCGGAVADPPFGLILPGSTQPRYPVEIWEGLLAFGIAALLIRWPLRRHFAGELGLAFLMLYSLARAWVDQFRVHLGPGWSPNMVASVAVVAAAGAVWTWRLLRDPTSLSRRT